MTTHEWLNNETRDMIVLSENTTNPHYLFPNVFSVFDRSGITALTELADTYNWSDAQDWDSFCRDIEMSLPDDWELWVDDSDPTFIALRRTTNEDN